jgi:arylsulfatase A-like enzyme/Flp pilus assembly protein TadD
MTRVVLACLAALAVACAAHDEADRHAAAAAAYLQRGELAKSRGELERAIALRPDRLDFRVRLGTVHAAAGRFRRAREEFEWVLARDPDRIDAWIAWGDAAAADGRPDDAFDMWRRAATRGDATPPLLARLGIVLEELGRAPKAVRVFRRAAARDATPSARMLAHWGAALEETGRTDEAEARYRAALARDPEEPTALLHLGGRLAGNPAQRARGVAMLETVVRRAPTDPRALEAAGRAYAEAGRYEESHALLRRAVAATADRDPALPARVAALGDVAVKLPRATPPLAAPNILLVLIDTLRADHVGCYGYARGTTPTIDALAAAGALFETTVSQAPWTAASAGTILTGLYPSAHGIDRGVRWAEGEIAERLPFLLQRSLGASVATLPETLRRGGYRTAAFVSNVYMNSIFGFGRGFDLYDDQSGDYASDVMTVKRRSDETNARVFAWLADHPAEPLFLLVHYNDPHWPYDPPGPLAGRWTAGYAGGLTPAKTALVVESEGRPVTGLTDADLAYLIGLYDGEIAAADRSLGHLLERVRLSSWSRPWVTVVTADHGEEFLEHGSTSHGYTLFEEQLRVPLVVNDPGRVRPARIHEPVQLVDVAPTILDIARVSTERPAMQGMSLVPLLDAATAYDPGPAFSEAPLVGSLAAVRTPGGLKLVVDAEHGRQSLFDLGADPHEKSDLSAARPADREALTQMLERWRAATRPSHPAETVVDEATKRRLTALGYVN